MKKFERPVQYFTDDYLRRCAKVSPEQIVEFLENYRVLVSNVSEKCQLISLKVEPSLLQAFKQKAILEGVPYQTQIKKLMKNWITSE